MPSSPPLRALPGSSDGEQALLDGEGGRLAVRIHADLAHLVLDRHHRQRGHLDRVEILMHVIRGQRGEFLGDLLLLLLGQGLLLELRAPFLAELVDGLAELLLELLLAARQGQVVGHILLQLGGHLVLVDHQGVHAGLCQIKFGLHHIFQDLAAVGGLALCPRGLDLRLDIGERDHLVAHDGHGLVHDSLIPLCGSGHARQHHQRTEGRNFQAIIHADKSQNYYFRARSPASPVPNWSSVRAFWR